MKTPETFTITGQVKQFDQVDGWHYVSVPLHISTKLKPYAIRGFVSILVTVGKTTWETSLLPKGNGTDFIALKASVRTAENIHLGKTIKVTFRLRER